MGADHPEAVLEGSHVSVGVSGMWAACAGGPLHEDAEQAAIQPHGAHRVPPRLPALQRGAKLSVQPRHQAAPAARPGGRHCNKSKPAAHGFNGIQIT